MCLGNLIYVYHKFDFCGPKKCRFEFVTFKKVYLGVEDVGSVSHITVFGKEV